MVVFDRQVFDVGVKIRFLALCQFLEDDFGHDFITFGVDDHLLLKLKQL